MFAVCLAELFARYRAQVFSVVGSTPGTRPPAIDVIQHQVEAGQQQQGNDGGEYDAEGQRNGHWYHVLRLHSANGQQGRKGLSPKVHPFSAD